MRRFRTYRLSILAIAALALILISHTGIFHVGMNMQDSSMFFCPFMGEDAICNMNPLEHIATWQSAFTTTAPGKGVVSLLVLLFASLLVLQTWKHILSRRRDPPIQAFRVRYKVYFPLTSSLQEAFSNGILNPKIF